MAKQLFDSLHATGLRFASTFMTLIFGIIATRLAGDTVFGEYVSLMAIAGLIAVATSVGLPALLGREVAVARGGGDRSKIMPFSQLLLAVNLLIGGFSAICFILGYTTTSLVFLFALLANCCGLLAAIFNGYERVLTSAWVASVVRPLIALSIAVALALMVGASAEYLLLAQAFGAGLGALIFLFLWNEGGVRQTGENLFKQRFSGSEYTSVLRLGAVFAATQLLISLTTQVDILILTALMTPEDVAKYYACARAALVVSFFYGSAAALAEPRLTRMYASGDIEGVKRLARHTAWMGFAMTVASGVAAYLLGPFYLGLYDESFKTVLDVMLIQIFGLVCWSVFGPAQVLMRATKLDSKLLYFTAVALLINAAITYLTVPTYGLRGAAVGTAAQFLVYGFMLSVSVSKSVKIRPDIFSALTLKT